MISSNYVSVSSEGIVYNQFYKGKFHRLTRTPIQDLFFENAQIEPGTLVLDVWKIFEKNELLGKIFDLSQLTPTDKYDTLPSLNKYLTVRWDAVFYPSENLFDAEPDIALSHEEGIAEMWLGEYPTFDELWAHHIQTDPTFIIVQDREDLEPNQLLTGVKDFKLIEILKVFHRQIILDSQGEI